MNLSTTSALATSCASFLTARLTEELASLWARDEARGSAPRGPGLAAQLEVVDSLLLVLTRGGLPDHRELRVLLFGYALHPDYDPDWVRLSHPAG